MLRVGRIFPAGQTHLTRVLQRAEIVDSQFALRA